MATSGADGDADVHEAEPGEPRRMPRCLGSSVRRSRACRQATRQIRRVLGHGFDRGRICRRPCLEEDTASPHLGGDLGSRSWGPYHDHVRGILLDIDRLMISPNS